MGLVAGVYIRVGLAHQPAQRADREPADVCRTRGRLLVARRRGAPAGHDRGALFVAIYIWVGVLSVLVPTQVWTLANYVMTTREAKRAFGLIGGGAILGWIVGGLATRQIVGAIRHREHAAVGGAAR